MLRSFLQIAYFARPTKIHSPQKNTNHKKVQKGDVNFQPIRSTVEEHKSLQSRSVLSSYANLLLSNLETGFASPVIWTLIGSTTVCAATFT